MEVIKHKGSGRNAPRFARPERTAADVYMADYERRKHIAKRKASQEYEAMLEAIGVGRAKIKADLARIAGVAARCDVIVRPAKPEPRPVREPMPDTMPAGKARVSNRPTAMCRNLDRPDRETSVVRVKKGEPRDAEPVRAVSLPTFVGPLPKPEPPQCPVAPEPLRLRRPPTGILTPPPEDLDERLLAHVPPARRADAKARLAELRAASR